MKKIGILIVFSVFLLLLSACGKEDKETTSGSGELLFSGENSGLSAPLSGETSTIKSGNSTGNQISSGEQIALSGGLSTGIQSQKGFSIELCNQIIAFSRCIISKAPIENQPVMKEQLQKAIEPWKLLADTQLREICQESIQQENFQQVLLHYKNQGCSL